MGAVPATTHPSHYRGPRKSTPGSIAHISPRPPATISPRMGPDQGTTDRLHRSLGEATESV